MLQAKVETLLRALPGTYGVLVREAGGDDSVAFNPDLLFSTASTIKVAILVELFRQVEAGRHRLDARLTVEERYRTGGAGVLSLLDPGLQPTVRDLAVLMTVLSDNTATNLLIELVGLEAVNAGLRRLRLEQTRLNRPVSFDADVTARDPLGVTTPREFARLFEALALGEAACPEVTAAMLGILEQQQYRTMLPRLIPNQVDHRTKRWAVPLAHKPGWVEGVRNDAGILFLPNGRRVVICFFSQDVPDERWTPDNVAEVAAAKVGLAVHEEYA